MSTDCIKGCLYEILRCIRDLPKREFKGEIRRLLLNILVNENDYIETPIIVQKIVAISCNSLIFCFSLIF